MSEVKVFRVVGEIKKPNLSTGFRKEIRALKVEDVLDSVYKEVGSNHRAKRSQIRILEVTEIGSEETRDFAAKKLIDGENEIDK